jgi:hypothetical protein
LGRAQPRPRHLEAAAAAAAEVLLPRRLVALAALGRAQPRRRHLEPAAGAVAQSSAGEEGQCLRAPRRPAFPLPASLRPAGAEVAARSEAHLSVRLPRCREVVARHSAAEALARVLFYESATWREVMLLCPRVPFGVIRDLLMRHVLGSAMRCGVICNWLEGVHILCVHGHDYPFGNGRRSCARGRA